MVSWFLPLIMKWNVRQEALSLAKSMSGGRTELGPGQFNAVQDAATRVYHITDASKAIGLTAMAIDRTFSDASVEAIVRAGKPYEFDDATLVRAGDDVTVTGTIAALETAVSYFGPEVAAPRGLAVVQENREIILTNRALPGREVGEIHDHVSVDVRLGVFLTSVKRMGLELPLLRGLVLKTSDELHFVGRPADRVQAKVGYKITASPAMDFVFFGLGMLIGKLVGLIQ